MRSERFNLREEVKVIPAYAIVVSVLAYAGTVALFLLLLYRHESNPPDIWLGLIVANFPAAILSLLVMLVGYVYRDSRRRGMNSTLWLILVFIVPNGIGFILYFLLRHPLKVPCPHCGTLATTDFNFCPNCKFNLHPVCPGCHRAVRRGDAFCPYCAHETPITPLSPPATA